MPDEINKNWKDHLALVMRSAASLSPMIGGPLAELITEAIPRQRQERIVEYIRQLSERLDTLEKERVDAILTDTERIDLIEIGGHLAARATTTERISRISEIVFRGLSEGETNLIRRKTSSQNVR